MYLRLLIGNLRKKKGQSIALAILFGISLALLITSIQIFNISTSQVRTFISKSNISSLILWKSYKVDDENIIDKFATEKDYISNVNLQDVLSINGDAMHFGTKETALPSSLSVFLTDYDNKNNLVFISDSDSKIILEPGEIAIPTYISDLTGTGIGDTVTIAIGGQKQKFTVRAIFKDALFGSEYISTKRVLLTPSDLSSLLNGQTQRHNTMVSFNLVNDSKVTQLMSDYSTTGLKEDFSIDKNLLDQIYLASNGMIAAVFFIAAIFISLICLIMQRYSVITTLQSEYEQIALMKATGFGLGKIKKVYLVKYCFVSFIGLLCGLCLGQLLFSVMTRDFTKNIVIFDHWKIFIITMMCSAFMWILFLYLAYFQMNRIKRFTPIELAYMRQAERKSVVFPVKLYRGTAKPYFTLAINDIANKPKMYLKYVMTLILCFTFILILNNLKMTLQSNELINDLGLTVGDIYTNISAGNHARTDLVKMTDNYNKCLTENGEKVTLGIDYYKYDTRIITKAGLSPEITALKSSSSTETFHFVEGTDPIAEDEIAMTTVLMKRYQKKIGDTITLEIDGVPKEYRITASNQALFNMGELILLPDRFEITGDHMGYQVIAYVSPEKENKSSYIAYLQSKYEFLQGATEKQVISRMTGNMIEQIALAIDLLIFIMFLFLCLVILLFTRLICFAEINSTRTLKAIGLDSSFLLSYQSIRIGAVVLFSLTASCFLSVTIGRSLVSSVFLITGLAKFNLIIYWLNTIFYFPLAFTLVTMCLSISVHIFDNKSSQTLPGRSL